MTASMHILGHCSRRNFEPKPRELRLDPALTPKWILDGHATDQGPQLRGYRAAPRLAFAARTPAPIRPPPATVPAQHGFGFHNEHRGSPAKNPETPVGILEAWPWFASVQDQQLLPEAKIVCNQQRLWSDSCSNRPQQTAKH